MSIHNLVIFELNPEEVKFYAISINDMSSAELSSINGIAFGFDDVTEAQVNTLNKLCTLLEEDKEVKLPKVGVTFNTIFHIVRVL